MKKFFTYLTALSIIFLSSCDNKDDIKKTVAALDIAIQRLDNNSNDWQKTLKDLEKTANDDAKSLIKNEVSDLMQRSVSAVGTNIKCIADFTGIRVKQQLVNMKNKILGIPLQPFYPRICTTIPDNGITLDNDRNPKNEKFEMFGFDFDKCDVTVLLENENDTVDITKYIDKPTSYSMTLNTGGTGIKFSDKAKRIIIKGKNDSSSFTLYSFGIFQPIPKICELEVIPYTPANYTFIPRHTAEDAEYNGHGPVMNFSLKLIVYPERIDAEIYMSAVETGGDPTVAEETRTITIYNALPNYRINRIVGQYTSALPNAIEDRDEEGFPVNLSGPVQQVILYGDGPDDNDAGTFTRSEITFAPLRIECEKLGNCIPRSQSLDSLKASIKILAADQKLYNSYLIK